MSRNVIVIGAGHNGLVAAFYLARAGLKPIVLERHGRVGGGAVTAEVDTGFRCPMLSHETLLHERIVRDMDLVKRGVELLAPRARVCAVDADRRPIVLHDDVARTVDSIRQVSAADADAYPAFCKSLARICAVFGAALTGAPPDIDRPSTQDIWGLLGLGRRFRALGRPDAYRLLRWLPMPVADLMAEWFAHPLLSAALAGPGLSGTNFGPRSAGSSLVLLMREAHRAAAHNARAVRGGPGALSDALAAAAAAAGAEIRLDSPVERIIVRDERVEGIIAAGAELRTSIVVSAVDPKTTFLRLLDPAELSPDVLWRARNYRASGTLAKVNLALSALPSFPGISDPGALSGRIHVGPHLDYLERAFDHTKYGEHSGEPWLELTIPTVLDPTLATAGGHVASIYVHYAPYQLRGTWAVGRETLLKATLRVLEREAPGISSLIVAAQVITPEDLERDHGFAGGHVFHGELAMDQLFTMRPFLGYARYASPIRGLFLCGGGTHPGGFLTGTSGRLAAQLAARHEAG